MSETDTAVTQEPVQAVQGESAAKPAPPKPGPPPTPAAPPAAGQDTPEIAGWMDGKTPELTVENASKVIAAIREDFRAERAKLKGGAEQARNDLAREIGKAIGLITDDEPADPAKLTEQLSATAAEAQQAKLALAVYQVAAQSGGDPVALLDSTSFLARLKGVDPGDGDALTAAVEQAVQANPRLAAASAVPGMRPNPAQGASGSPPATRTEQIAAAESAGDLQAVLRLKAQMALDPNNSF